MMLSVIMLCVIMLSVFMLGVIMLSDGAPCWTCVSSKFIVLERPANYTSVAWGQSQKLFFARNLRIFVIS
jgi:hypothetical protein